MNPILIWFGTALLLLAGLWSANYLLPMLRVVRTYWPSPLRGLFVPVLLPFCVFFTLLAIELNPESTPTDPQTAATEFRESLNAELAQQGREYFDELVKNKLIRIESSVQGASIRPEIAYSLGTVLSTFRDVVGPRRLLISSINDRNHARNSFHYRNLAIDFPISRLGISPQQGVRIRKLLQQRLGPGYRVIYGTEGHTRHLHIQYEGKSWDADKVMALPLLEAATLEKVDPALMLAWAKVTSGFDPQYNDQRGRSGMLGLQQSYQDSISDGDTLRLRAYLRSGARQLHTCLQALQGDSARAFAALRVGVEKARQESPPWWKDPVLSLWVDQILLEAKNYRRQIEGERVLPDNDTLPEPLPAS